MKNLLFIIGVVILFGCASQKKGKASNKAMGDTRTQQVEFLDENTYLLNEKSNDKSYGYDKSNPIKVGGAKEGSGPRNERRFLNALLGPNGEKVSYYRAGSCCAFQTPNGTFDNMGLLDRYRLSWEGASDTLDIYINMYDKGDLKIPVGLNAKKK
jgi:hypothetical protein